MIMKKRLLPIFLAVLMVFALMPMTVGTVYAEENNSPSTPLTSEITTKAYTNRISVVVNSNRYANEGLFFPIVSRQKATPEKLGSDTYVLDLQDNGVGHTYFIDGLNPGTQYYVFVAAFYWQPGYDGYLRFSDWSEPIAVKTQSAQLEKKANPLTIKPKTATVKYSKLKKKTQTLAVTKVIKFTKQLKDKKTYTLSYAKKGNKSFKKYFKVNKTNGKVTVKKGLKKGTYKVKVKVKALGNTNYKPSAVKAVTFTVKVK